MVKLAGEDPMVTGLGVKVAVAPGGRPVAESVTGKLKGPPIGRRLKLKIAAAPGITVCVVAVGPTEASVKLKSRIYCVSMAEVLVMKLESPL